MFLLYLRQLVMLNRLDQGFPADLEELDSIPVRNNDTVFIFYHKAGQTTKEQVCFIAMFFYHIGLIFC